MWRTRSLRSGEYGKLVSIAEMTVDVELFCIRAGSSLGGHKGVSHPIWANIGIVFTVRFEASDEGVTGLEMIFKGIKLNAGSI